jgi:APA family basic amino acid/polyamine antiporter
MLKELCRKKSVDRILRETQDGLDSGASLKRALRVRDLTAFGIAAIMGSGVFTTIGPAAFDGGPAISLLFIFVAIACGFSAFCYAEFSSMIPISGSAYTYAYASFGELVAWIIGWDLLLEYAIGNIAIAIAWSSYLTTSFREPHRPPRRLECLAKRARPRPSPLHRQHPGIADHDLLYRFDLYRREGKS